MLLLLPVVLAPLFLFGGAGAQAVGPTPRTASPRRSAYAGETLDALETVQAFGREALAPARFGDGGGDRLPRLACRASAPAR